MKFHRFDPRLLAAQTLLVEAEGFKFYWPRHTEYASGIAALAAQRLAMAEKYNHAESIAAWRAVYQAWDGLVEKHHAELRERYSV